MKKIFIAVICLFSAAAFSDEIVYKDGVSVDFVSSSMAGPGGPTQSLGSVFIGVKITKTDAGNCIKEFSEFDSFDELSFMARDEKGEETPLKVDLPATKTRSENVVCPL